MRRLLVCLIVAAASLCAIVQNSAAQESIESFYKGRTLTLFIGSGAGGGYDRYARTFAQHIGRHIAGHPNIIAKNMPGASGLRLANYLYNKAPKDGSQFAIIQNSISVRPLQSTENVHYEPQKMNWLASANILTNTCVVWHTSKVQSIQEAMKTAIIVGGEAVGTSTINIPRYLNQMIGTKFKIVKGYPGTASVMMALERGEVDGLCGIGWDSLRATRFNLLKENKIKIILQVGPVPHPDLKGVPFVGDLLTSEQDRPILDFLLARLYIGRPFVAPPGVPLKRVLALRTAFMDTMKDPKFLAQAKKARLPILPVSGEKVQAHIEKLSKTSRATVAAASEILLKGTVLQAKLKWIKADNAEIVEVKRRGRTVYFKHDGKRVKGSARKAKVMIGGNKAKRNQLKAGMTCDITYLGDGDAIGRISCK